MLAPWPPEPVSTVATTVILEGAATLPFHQLLPAGTGIDFTTALRPDDAEESEVRGRLVETAAGAHLLRGALVVAELRAASPSYSRGANPP